MFDAHRSPTHAARWVALAVAALLASTALVAGPLASPASAVDISVDSQAEFELAVAQVNGLSTVYTITFENDIDFSSVGARTFTSESTVTIDGAGFAARCVEESPCGGFFAAENLMGLTIMDLTIDGFRDSAVVIDSTPTDIGGVTFENNTIYDEGSPAADAIGGALRITGTTQVLPVIVQGSVFVNNYVGTGTGYALGAAVFVDGYAGFYDTSFAGNYAYASEAGGTAHGGAVYATNDVVWFEDAQFTGNQAYSWDGTSRGGAVNMVEGFLEVYDTLFEDNEASYGGAVAAIDTDHEYSLYTNGAVFKENSAGFWGGAVYIHQAVAELTYSEFRDNESGSAGGAVVVNESSVFVGNSLLVGNYASSGGALSAINDSELTIYASTLTENDANGGGALWMSFSTTSLNHVTIAGNMSQVEGPMNGIPGGQIGAQYATMWFTNSVLVEPTDGGANCGFFSMTINSDGYNVADDESCGLDEPSDTASEDVDAQLGPLKFNGGPTHTMVPDQGSILIDAITGQECIGESSDQRDVMRAQGLGCDIGAVETFEPIYRSVPTPGGSVMVRFLNAIEGEGFPEVEHVDVNTLSPAPPAGVSFPYGGLGMEIAVWDDGWPVDVDIATPAPTNQFWKLLNGTWVEYPATSQVSEGEGIWSFRLIDGGAGDNDGEENSLIVDPVAMGVGAAFTG